MHFYRSSFETNSDHLVPSYNLVSEMKSDRKLYNCKVSDVVLGDVVFDIVFLEITEKLYMESKNSGYNFKAVNSDDVMYNAYIREDETIFVVDPDHLGFLSELNLY